MKVEVRDSVSYLQNRRFKLILVHFSGDWLCLFFVAISGNTASWHWQATIKKGAFIAQETTFVRQTQWSPWYYLYDTVSDAIKALLAIIIAQILTTADLSSAVPANMWLCLPNIFSVIQINSLFVLKPLSVPFRIRYSASGTPLITTNSPWPIHERNGNVPKQETVILHPISMNRLYQFTKLFDYICRSHSQKYSVNIDINFDLFHTLSFLCTCMDHCYDASITWKLVQV